MEAPTLLPARVPVRVFPSIWVAGGTSSEEAYLLDRLAAHLAEDGRAEVRRIDFDQVAEARATGEISALTAVVRVELSLIAGVQRHTDANPVQYCGPYGCYVHYQPYTTTVAELRGEAVLTVHEGPSGRELQRERFAQTQVGGSGAALRARVVADLAGDLARAVDTLPARERFVLLRTKLPAADDALELIAQGKRSEGRALLERVSRSLGGLDAVTQSKVWYDLGVARTLAPGPGGLDARAAADARRAFAWALRTHRAPLYERGLAQLVDAQRRRRVSDEQARALEHNYALLPEDWLTPEPTEPAEDPTLDAGASTPPPATLDAGFPAPADGG